MGEALLWSRFIDRKSDNWGANVLFSSLGEGLVATLLIVARSHYLDE